MSSQHRRCSSRDALGVGHNGTCRLFLASSGHFLGSQREPSPAKLESVWNGAYSATCPRGRSSSGGSFQASSQDAPRHKARIGSTHEAGTKSIAWGFIHRLHGFLWGYLGPPPHSQLTLGLINLHPIRGGTKRCAHEQTAWRKAAPNRVRLRPELGRDSL